MREDSFTRRSAEAGGRLTGIDCGAARRRLWPGSGPKATSPDIIAAQEHLADCADCQRFMAEMQSMADLLSAVDQPSMPHASRERIFGSLARHRAARADVKRRAPSGLLVAAGIVAAIVLVTLGALQVLNKTADGGDVYTALAQDHAHTVSNARLISSDRSAISAWLAGRVPFVVFVPVLPNTQLHGARLAMMDGRTVAVVEYTVNSDMLSYFILPAPSTTARGSDENTAGIHLLPSSRNGYEIISWNEDGLLHAMVGRMSEAQLGQYAKDCLQQMNDAMSRVGIVR